MYKVIGLGCLLMAISACRLVTPETTMETYCLAENEANGLDYMVVTENYECERGGDDVEWYEAPTGMHVGSLAYVEKDSSHSSGTKKSKTTINPVTSYPAFDRNSTKSTPTPPKICLKANSKPAPKPPNPAPVAPKPVQPAPAPVVPKPAPAQTSPKAPAPAPTAKPGC